jgi:hypothetical protein
MEIHDIFQTQAFVKAHVLQLLQVDPFMRVTFKAKICTRTASDLEQLKTYHSLQL